MSGIDSVNGFGVDDFGLDDDGANHYRVNGFGVLEDPETAQLDLAVRRHVLMRLHEWHGIEPSWVRPDRPLAELGLTSRDAVALAAELSELAEVALPATVLWEEPTLDLLARHVCGQTTQTAESARSQSASQTAAAPPAAEPQDVRGVEIAVVGVGCRLPGSISSADDFWRLLTEGVDAIGTVPEDRWSGFVADGDPALDEVRRHGGFLDDIAGFDAEFFGIAPVEAATMDPQQRLLLEVAHEALDHAAIPATSLGGSRTGVFVGISGNEYVQLTTADLSRVDAWTPSGSALSIAANRLSYLLDLRGPSMAVDTACSSSLVAVHHAVRSLLTGECDTASPATAPVQRPLQSSDRSSPATAPVQRPLQSSDRSSPATAPVQRPLQSSDRSSPATAPVQRPLQSSDRSSPATAPPALVANSSPATTPIHRSSLATAPVQRPLQSSDRSSPARAPVQRALQSSDRSSLATSQLRLSTNKWS